jgi:ribonuclease R
LNDYKAEKVAKILGNGPKTQDELADDLGAVNARGRRDLRRLLNGMLRSGDLTRDQSGNYHVPADASVQQGVIERNGRDLTFAGLVVEGGRRSSLRPGDLVEASVSGGDVRIIKVVERSGTPLVGILRTHTRYPHVESLSPDYRGRVSLLEPPAQGEDGDTVAVKISDEDRRGLVGVVVSTLARSGGADQAATTMLANFQVPQEWPDGVEAAVARLPTRVNAGGHTGRESLLDLPLVTIDGESARDFDDAVFAEKRRGGWRLVVAIADVGHYVKIGSVLDKAAWERGTSVYLPDRVIPMLPEQISNELCSLKPEVPRLALVCDMKVSTAGRVTEFSFYEAVIRSWQRLTYTRVQEYLDTGTLDVVLPVRESLSALQEVFRQAREARGGLDFDTHEGRLELDQGRIVAIHPETRLEANRLIEEAMIAANVSAAEFLQRAGVPGLYRIHEPPKADRIEALRQAFAYAGVRLARGEVTPMAVCDALKELGEVSNRWLFEYQVLRSLNQAVYSPDNKGHFGLALKSYMHFTSPIRRYPDLVVHRAIKHVLAGKGAVYSMDELEATGIQASMCERRADETSWGVDAWLKCEYVAQWIGDSFAGVIMGVTEFGLFIELSGFYVQGLLHISELGSDYFQYRPETQALVGERSGRRFRLGDDIQVILRGADPEQGKLDLQLVQAAGTTGDKRRGRPRSLSHSKERSGGRRRKR